MSSRNSLELEDALELLMQEMTLDVISTAYSEVAKVSKTAAEYVEEKYDKFFAVMYEMLDSDETPSKLIPYLELGGWADVSKRWGETKEKYGSSSYNSFYVGISSFSETRKFLGRPTKNNPVPGTYRIKHKTRRPNGVAKVKPFSTYISSLRTAGTTSRFFGPVSLSYEIQSSHDVKFTVKMGPNERRPNLKENEIRQIMTHGKGGLVSKPDDIKIIGRVEAFRFLEEVARTETAIVDMILKRIDPEHENQWVKINGSKGWGGKGHRPLRPLIQPLVHYFIFDLLPKEMQSAYRGM